LNGSALITDQPPELSYLFGAKVHHGQRLLKRLAVGYCGRGFHFHQNLVLAIHPLLNLLRC
jgi:hypothetical protein